VSFRIPTTTLIFLSLVLSFSSSFSRSSTHICRTVLFALFACFVCLVVSVLSNSTLSSGAMFHKSKTHSSSSSSSSPDDNRPEHKVVLLCGPPGLGKTTLAHILAKHAGYASVELNASDDRSTETLVKKVKDATEMQSVLSGGRPNCLIIDEIDGAMGGTEGKGAINALVKIITADGSKKDKNKDGQQANIKKKKKAQGGRLNRPIVCIANDQYAPALRPLRQIAKIFVFDKPSKPRLVERLVEICKAERMAFDQRALDALCDMVENDIRSCLNTLQFIHSRKIKLTERVLHSLAIAQKDVEKSRFAIWENLLTLSSSSSTSASASSAASSASSSSSSSAVASKRNNTNAVGAMSARVNRLCGLMVANGEVEKVVDGLFHNYLLSKYNDPTLSKSVECSEWLCAGDVIGSHERSDVESAFALQAYLPYMAVGLALICARPRRPKIENPKVMFENKQKYERNFGILQAFLCPKYDFFFLLSFFLLLFFFLFASFFLSFLLLCFFLLFFFLFSGVGALVYRLCLVLVLKGYEDCEIRVIRVTRVIWVMRVIRVMRLLEL